MFAIRSYSFIKSKTMCSVLKIKYNKSNKTLFSTNPSRQCLHSLLLKGFLFWWGSLLHFYSPSRLICTGKKSKLYHWVRTVLIPALTTTVNRRGTLARISLYQFTDRSAIGYLPKMVRINRSRDFTLSLISLPLYLRKLYPEIQCLKESYCL